MTQEQSKADTLYVFPSDRTLSNGLTLRDAAALAALQGLCANPGGPFQANDRSGWGFVNCTADDVATTAYHMADSMLRARAA